MAKDSVLTTTSTRIQSNVSKAFSGYYRLKDFIHEIRNCKTLAEERELVAKEAADIRTSFKDGISAEQVHHAIAKLLFINMMGYPAHFGQVESLKMVASPQFSQKRLGYLGSTQFLDEQQPTLTLITNSIKFDLNSTCPTTNALALANLATTVSPDIARDLADEVERLLRVGSPHTKKKAAFCAARMINRVPELTEFFEDRIQSLIGDKSHAVVLGGLAMLEQLILVDVSAMNRVSHLVLPTISRQLQSCISGSYSSEYEVSGISDPFLQVRLLKLMRLIARGDHVASEAISDVLTQVASSTDSSKNVGHAVLYEVAVTIMSIESDPALRSLAINILGRLLSQSNDSNMRYVALNLLNRVVSSSSDGFAAVQRHRLTILECLSDPDISIMKRAMDLALALISRDTIRNIALEIMQVLKDMNSSESIEAKNDIITRMAIKSAQYAPSAKWYVDTLIFLLSQMNDSSQLVTSDGAIIDPASNSRRKEVVSTFLRIVSNSKELHRYSAEELFAATVKKESRIFGEGKEENLYVYHPTLTIALKQATVWIFGEYFVHIQGISPAEVVIQTICDWTCSTATLSPALAGYSINAIGKIVNRAGNNMRAMEVLESIADGYRAYPEIQYRAKEMSLVIRNSTLCSILLGCLPDDINGDQLGNIKDVSSGKCAKDKKSPVQNSPPSPTTSPTLRSPHVLDVFAELASLSLDGVRTPISSHSPLSDSFGNVGHPTSHAVPSFEKDGVALSLIFKGSDNSSTTILAEFRNSSNVVCEALQLQCAVPKSLKLRLEPASDFTLRPGALVTQLLKISSIDPKSRAETFAPRDKIKLRLKIAYNNPDVQTNNIEINKI